MCPSLSLTGAPILLLVYFHKAVRTELEELRRDAENLAVGLSGFREMITEFRRKFEFFKVMYNYHSTVEDEVVFFSLDIRIKNVVCTYMLEHDSIDEMFDAVSYCLNVLIEVEECTSTQFQELYSSIGTIKATLCQHMLKEEEQIFPLLLQNFSSNEQASLIWQYFCTAPTTLLQYIFPWLASFLSSDEHKEILRCMKEVLPDEELLHKVVNWLYKGKISTSAISTEIEKEAQVPTLLTTTEDIVSASASIYGEKQIFIKTIDHKAPRHIFSGSLHKWNGVIRKYLQGILTSLALTRSSRDFSAVDSVIVQLKFFTDVLTFFSVAYALIPLLGEPGNVSSSHIRKIFQVENQTKRLRRLMCRKTQNSVLVNDFLENITRELELFLTGINEYLALLEREVFPLVVLNFKDKLKKWLLYVILHILPLGLLKCIITCFSSHLSENECNSILNGLKDGSPEAKNYNLESLLYKWVRMGNSGKTSAENCIKALQEMYLSRNLFLTKYVTENEVSFSLHMKMQHTNCFTNEKLEPQSNVALYSRTIIPVFIPQQSDSLTSFQKVNPETSNASSIFELERRPVDHLLYFHKALRNELEHLLTLSMELGDNKEGLKGFRRRFQLIRTLYQIHSDSEDEIAFPALEAKGKAINISQSYVIDHKLEIDLFDKISFLLEEIFRSHASVCDIDMTLKYQRTLNYQKLCLELYGMCRSLRKILCDHVDREETELWPLFREFLTIEEQEKVIGSMLGRMNAEILQEMIPWIMASLTLDEKKAMMSLWHNATKNTMFNEWLGEWWEEMKVENVAKVEEKPNNVPSSRAELLEVLSTYLTNKVFDGQDQAEKENCDKLSQVHMDYTEKVISGEINNHHFADSSKQSREAEKKKGKESTEFSTQVGKPSQHVQICEGVDSKYQERIHTMSQDELEAAIRKISSDSTLDSQKKSFLIQSLLTSRWITSQEKSHSDVSDKEEFPGQSPSYRDPLKLIFGCKHYKRNCKLVAACCNRLFTCRICHDEVNNHTMDRKATANMMCMKCLRIQPVGPTCSTPTCQNLSMAKYYCKICKFLDDERDIYHCPYCNLCRVGKGLGIDYFHCMNCNACMSRSLIVHPCREKCFEDNCPICHEFIFTSSSPVKALSCGHLMHSACFQDYTFSHYTCPICSKSLGNMQVYFGMLDALLAEEKVPDEYSGQIQRILCNDCEKRGAASFHWLYHKCSQCGSYNTRLL